MRGAVVGLMALRTLALYPTNPVRYVDIRPVRVAFPTTGPARSATQTGAGVGCGCGVRVYASHMSIPVAIEDLAAATGGYGWAYLLTVRDDLRPQIVAVAPAWDGELLLMDVGRGTARNASARSSISLCYPPVEDGGYSLIVDGRATVEGEASLRFAPTGAVLHRPAPDGFTGSATGCGNDCEPVGPSGG